MTEKQRSKNRQRQHCIRVYVLPEERAIIEEKAYGVNLSVSGYLRSLGLDFTLQSRADVETAISLTRVGADQGRLGGLLKKLITIAEDTGRMRAEEIRTLLHDIENAQRVIKDLVSVLRNRKKF